jgi:hypothetical protein
MDDALHEDARRVDAGGGNITQRNDMTCLDDCHFGGHRHDRVEVPRAFAMRQIAPAIGLPGVDQGDIARQGVFQQTVAAVDYAGLAASNVPAPVGV